MRSISRPASAVVAAMLLGAPVAMANSLSMPFASLGREDTNPLSLTYTYQNPTSGLLSIKSNLTSVSISSDGGQTFSPKFGTFDLEAAINPTTGTATSGSVSLQTYVTGKSGSTQTIWSSAQLTDFGFTPNLAELDFKFIQSGTSALAGVHDGSAFGIIIYAQSGLPTNANWGSSFTASVKNDGGAFAPAPSTGVAGVLLLGLAGASLAVRRRFQQGGEVPAIG